MMFTVNSLPSACRAAIVRFRSDYKTSQSVRSNYIDVMRMYHRIKVLAHTSILFSISGELDVAGTAEDWMDVLDDLGLLNATLTAELEDHISPVEDCDE